MSYIVTYILSNVILFSHISACFVPEIHNIGWTIAISLQGAVSHLSVCTRIIVSPLMALRLLIAQASGSLIKSILPARD